MRPEDLREMSRRLEEIMFIAERGYEPLYDETLGEWMCVKCHWGSIHTLAGALEESGRDERRVA
jgi:hypothetical protein